MTVKIEYTHYLKLESDKRTTSTDSVPSRVVRHKGSRETDLRCPICLERTPDHRHNDYETIGTVNQYGERVFTEPYTDDYGFCFTCEVRINIFHIYRLRVTIRK